MEITTGMARNIDELGRVVIPKKVREQLGIKDGDMFEILTSCNGDIILRSITVGKYKQAYVNGE